LKLPYFSDRRSLQPVSRSPIQKSAHQKNAILKLWQQRQGDPPHWPAKLGEGKAILLLTRLFFERRMQNISEVQFEQLARTF